MVCADPLGPLPPLLGAHSQASMHTASDVLQLPPNPLHKAVLGLPVPLPCRYRKPEAVGYPFSPSTLSKAGWARAEKSSSLVKGATFTPKPSPDLGREMA